MPDHEVGITDLLVPRRAELTERVAWFVRLRWLAVGGMLLAVPVGKKLLGFEKIDGQRILALAGALFLLNCCYVLISRALHRPRDGGSPDLRKVELFAKAQVLLDLLILTAILHYSGGIRNPFSFYYIFHVIISSILLSRRSAYGVAALCLGLFGAMALLEHFGVFDAHPLNALQQKPSAGYVLTAIMAMGTTLFTAIFMATSIMQRLKQKEDGLEKAWREVKQLEATKSRFLVLVSHEMRSPIVAIRSMLDALGVAYSKCLGEKAVEMLSRASERADSLLTLTKDLLTLARQQSMQEHHAEQEIVDLAASTRNGILLFKAEADEKSIVLKESYPEKAIGVRTDHDSMNLVLSNLISNAIRYTPAGGQVGVSWQLEGRRAMLKVSDTGIGIPESELPHMFKEFFRAENARKFTASGTGLGLAITKNIVERLGGTIAVESRLNEGSTFTGHAAIGVSSRQEANMHEMSIAIGIVETLKEEMAKHPDASLKKVKLSIGEFSGVETETLAFALEVALDQENFNGVQLDINKVPLEARCRKCSRLFKPESSGFRCDNCGSDSFDIEAGQSVTVDSITVE